MQIKQLIAIQLLELQFELQIAKLNELIRDKITLDHHIGKFNFKRPYPFDALYKWAEETLGEEAQELLVSIILEPFGNLIDNLSSEMSDNNQSKNKMIPFNLGFCLLNIGNNIDQQKTFWFLKCSIAPYPLKKKHLLKSKASCTSPLLCLYFLLGPCCCAWDWERDESGVRVEVGRGGEEIFHNMRTVLAEGSGAQYAHPIPW